MARFSTVIQRQRQKTMHLRVRLDAAGNDHNGVLHMRAMAAMAFEKVMLDRHYPDIISLDCLVWDCLIYQPHHSLFYVSMFTLPVIVSL